MSYEMYWWITVAIWFLVHGINHGKPKNQDYNVFTYVIAAAIVWWILKHFGVWDAQLYWRW